jgi:hypothetical protein
MGQQIGWSVEAKLLYEIKQLTRALSSRTYIQVFPTFASFPIPGITGTLYVDEATGDIYVWNGTSYVLLSSGITALNGLIAAAQLLTTGSSGTDFNISSVGTTHTFNIPTASATNRGLVSSADWSTFNSKIGGTGTTNYVAKFTGSTILGNSQILDGGTYVTINGTDPQGSRFRVADNTALNFSNLGGAAFIVGTRGFGSSLFVNTPSLNDNFISGFGVDGTYNSGKSVINLNALCVFSGGPYSADMAFKTSTNTTLSEKMRLTNTGELLINTTTITAGGYNLQVAGGIYNTTGAVLAATSGNVGIRTTTPQGGLDINNGLSEPISTTATPNGSLIIGSSATNAAITIGVNGGNAGFIQNRSRISAAWFDLALNPNGGNVGIGTTSPAQKLEVVGAIRANGGTIFAQGSGTEASGWQLNAITQGYDLTNGYGWITAGGASTRANLILQFGGGNVGIGTASPSTKLHLESSSSASSMGQFIKNSAGSTTNNSSDIWFGTWAGASISSIYNARISALNVNGVNAATDLLFYTYDGSSITEKIRLTSSGNVGIGTTSPQVRLHTFGTTGIRAETSSGNSSTGLDFASAFVGGRVGGFYMYPGGPAIGNNVFGESANNVIQNIIFSEQTFPLKIGTIGLGNYQVYTNSSERMRITSGGNVLVGTTTDGGRLLQVAGRASITSTTNNQLLLSNDTGAAATSFINLLNNRNTLNDEWGILFVDSFRERARIRAINKNTGNAQSELIFTLDTDNNQTPDNTVLLLSSAGFSTVTGNLGISTSTFGTSATNTFAISSGTAPTTSPADAFQMYSADVVAGNAAPHIRTENGAVLKMYQETTGVGNAAFVQGSVNAVYEDSTFDGYTLKQIVKALRNQGLLA